MLFVSYLGWLVNLEVEVNLLNVPGQGAIFGEDFGAMWADDPLHPVHLFDVPVKERCRRAQLATQRAFSGMIKVGQWTLLFLRLFLLESEHSC